MNLAVQLFGHPIGLLVLRSFSKEYDKEYNLLVTFFYTDITTKQPEVISFHVNSIHHISYKIHFAPEIYYIFRSVKLIFALDDDSFEILKIACPEFSSKLLSFSRTFNINMKQVFNIFDYKHNIDDAYEFIFSIVNIMENHNFYDL